MINFISINFIYIRNKKNLSQRDVGALLGSSYHSIGSYELGKSLPPIDKIQVFCKEYKISIDDFVNTDLSKKKEETSYNVNESPASYKINEPIELYERMLKGKDDVILQNERVIKSKDELIASLEKSRNILEAIVNQISKN